MPKLIFIFSIFFVYLISCKENLEPLNKNPQYSINIMYIKDDNLPSFEAKDFIDIFNSRMPFLTYQILGYKIKYNLAYGNNLNGFYRENRNIIRKNANLFEDKKLSDITRSSEYWKIIGKETNYYNYNMIIVNIPLNSKVNEGDKIIDRLIFENKKIKPAKSLAIVSVYPLFNGNLKYENEKILLNIFEYYILQTVAMIFPKYDIHEFEKHSIMSEVKNFDYYNWFSNIINFPLREPYKTLKKYER
ncbi:hypothetical protein [Brachyspira catarrhinii]|uniref:Lipoprotein n=1 Tax=Brachyspira catarrhinii TaxID=2528966 RepID=A0ABY2TT03_9SPIR|nr:hypothetical protein [Brachyspira catarrhinii]TKZ36002.1 hypothetical protein EZH24_02300 [Brachyspira catarrhinii]